MNVIQWIGWVGLALAVPVGVWLFAGDQIERKLHDRATERRKRVRCKELDALSVSVDVNGADVVFEFRNLPRWMRDSRVEYQFLPADSGLPIHVPFRANIYGGQKLTFTHLNPLDIPNAPFRLRWEIYRQGSNAVEKHGEIDFQPVGDE